MADDKMFHHLPLVVPVLQCLQLSGLTILSMLLEHRHPRLSFGGCGFRGDGLRRKTCLYDAGLCGPLRDGLLPRGSELGLEILLGP